MSEYQYYEFQAVDRPLSPKDRAALRAITSRAEITATSLINEYHWGDFKGDPDRLMDRYFDAHLYVANWGTHRLMFRVPADALDLKTVKPYRVPYVFQGRSTDGHVVLDFHSEEEGGDDFEGGEGWLASLMPLRSDLLAGDIRCLYLGWLSGLRGGEVDEEAPEPPPPPGLRKLSASLKRLAEFLRVDLYLLDEAATHSGDRPAADPDPDALADWVTRLPAGEKDRLLTRVVRGEAVHLREELLRRIRKERSPDPNAGADAGGKPRRTAGELLQAAERRAEATHRREEARATKLRERRERERAEARARHLDGLAGREPELWQQVEAAIAARQPKEYDRAVTLLQDLRDLAERSGTAKVVAERVRQLRERHRAKSTLIRRLNQAGFHG